MEFLIEVVPLFENFAAFFQSVEPQVHVLHTRMSELVERLLLRILKPEALAGKSGKELKAIDPKNVADHLSDDDIVLGHDTRQALRSIPKESRHRVIVSMRAFYMSAAVYLLPRLPLDNPLLQNLIYFQPKKSFLPESLKAICDLVQKMPHMDSKDAIDIADEWRAYRLDADTISLSENAEGKRVDHYWRDVISLQSCDGSYKYAKMGQLVKAALILPHGNADVERGFSVNNDVLTDQRTEMTPATLNALLLTKDAIKRSDPENQLPQSISVTRGLLQACKAAHTVYQCRLEKEKQEKEQAKAAKAAEEEKKEQEKRLMEIQEAEKASAMKKNKQMQKDEEEAQLILTAGQAVLAEGNRILTEALKSKNFKQVTVAHMMLEQGQKKISESSDKLQKIHAEKKTLCLASSSRPKESETKKRDDKKVLARGSSSHQEGSVAKKRKQ
jgi:hypothetical protein